MSPADATSLRPARRAAPRTATASTSSSWRRAARLGRRLALASAPILVLAGLTGSGDPAGASPTPSLATVETQVAALQQQAERTSERYDGMLEQLSSVQVELSAARQRVAAERRQVALAREYLGRLAAQTYQAGDLSNLALLLGDDPQSWLAQNGVMDTLDSRAVDAVARLVREQHQLRIYVAQVSAQRSRVAAAGTQIQAAKREVNRQLAAAQDLVLALTLAQRTALQEFSLGTDRQQLQKILGPSVTVPASGLVSCADVGLDLSAPRVGAVLSYACDHLGDSYVWAGAGPDVFDCSGLTMRSWQQAGVSLPHNAAEQADLGTHVSAADLQPGDLVFFYAGLSHVGIYIGRGLMINAPHAGDVVRIAPVTYSALVTASRY